MIQFHEAVGMRISELLEQKNKSLRSLAQASGIDKSNLSKIIAGEMECKCPTIKKICDGLNVTPAYFFCSPLFDEAKNYVCQSLKLQAYFDKKLDKRC